MTTGPSWRPADPDTLADRLAGWLATTAGRLRVAVDGAPATDPDAFAAALTEPLRARGRAVAQVRADGFWRDAALRLEHGHTDVESYLTWLDAAALRREVLAPAADAGHYLPSLRDPRTNRATREAPRELGPNGVLLISGSLLLGRDLPFERAIHLHLPAATLARRTAPELAWTLPAYDRYDATARPIERADVTVRLDRRTPAVRGLPDG